MLWCGLISIGMILVGNDMVSGCSGMGLVVQQWGLGVQRLASHGLVELIFCLSQLFFFIFFSPFESRLRESLGLVELMDLMWQIKVVD